MKIENYYPTTQIKPSLILRGIYRYESACVCEYIHTYRDITIHTHIFHRYICGYITRSKDITTHRYNYTYISKQKL